MDLPFHEALLAKRFKMLVLALLPFLLLSTVSEAEVRTKYRLPKLAEPSEYKLAVQPDLKAFKFTGNVMIKLTTQVETPVLVLNQANLTITDVKLAGKVVKKFDSDPDYEILTIEFTTPLEKGKPFELHIEFSGELNDKNRGFYRSRYFDQENKVNWIATTHFEPTGARLAFPCWDEPAYKAVFLITIRHLSKYTAVISNMPIQSTKKIDKTDLSETIFKPTKRMSTYLVAYVVSDYKYKGNDTFKVFTKPNAVDQTQYALDFGVKVIERLDEYTGIKYREHMEKMDQVSVKDFNPGAMENWGLVTYRETALLYEEGVTTTRSKQSIATIIAHEFAHQWFGNLVSPKWWEFIWLNEGFANYFQYYITNLIEPSWRLMELYAVDVTQGNAFIADANANSRPMNKPVDKPSEISALFDSIAYQKAGSVIRMMSHIVTPELFRKGLQTYLKTKALGVADSDELISHVQAAAGKQFDGKEFKTIMNEWITKAGYPLVTVKKSSDGGFELSQERFLLYGSDKQTKWWVPVTYATKDDLKFENTTPTHWLKPTNETLKIKDVKDWILVNKQQTGYYRVNYEKENWKHLSAVLQEKLSNIDPINRAQLVDDVLIMARTNRTDYNTALSLTLYLHNETDYIPWTATFRNLNFLQSMMQTSKNYKIFQSYMGYIMHAVRNQTGYEILENDTHVVKLLKQNLMKWACTAGVKECVKYATDEFENWYNSSKPKLHPDQKTNILCVGLKDADEKKWNDALIKLATSTEDADERNTLLKVMGCSNNGTILENFLRSVLKNDSLISFEHAIQAVVANHVDGVELALKVLETDYEQIKMLDKYESKLRSSIETIGNAIVTSDHYIRLSLFNVKGDIQADIVQSTTQKSMRNIEWVDRFRADVDSWLKEYEDTFNSSGMLMTSSLLLILSIFITRFY